MTGRAFYVMEHLDGRIFWDQRLPGLLPDERREMFQSMNRVIADLHSVEYVALGLEDFGRPGNYMARQIVRWSRQYRASETVRQPAMNALIDWLPAHLPPEGTPSIVHGDYRMDNLVFHKTEPRVIGVLDLGIVDDWRPARRFRLSHDRSWRIDPDLYQGLAWVDVGALGIPAEAEYVAAYCRSTGRAGIGGWEFYLAYSLFRFAAICQGIAKRAIDGTAASAEAAAIGGLARPFGEQAWALAQSLGPAAIDISRRVANQRRAGASSMAKEKVGVVGAGLMGAEIALVFALAGHEVLLSDTGEPQLAAALERLNRTLDRGVQRGFYKDDEKPLALAGASTPTVALEPACRLRFRDRSGVRGRRPSRPERSTRSSTGCANPPASLPATRPPFRSRPSPPMSATRGALNSSARITFRRRRA